LRILLINSIQLYGGGEVWMVTAATELIRRGHDVTIVGRPGSLMLPYARRTGARVLPLEMHGDFDPRTIWSLVRSLRRHCIEIILTNTDKELRFAGAAARLCHNPPVIARRGIDLPLKNTTGYRLTYNVLARAVVANSEATKRTLVGSVPWLDPDRVHVIHNGIDPDRFAGDKTRPLRQELGLPGDAQVIGFVGRLCEQKGIEHLLAAFARIAARRTDTHLLLVGDGELRDLAIAFARRHDLGGRLHLTGFRDDVPAVMRSLDVCVLPSLWEGFGIVLIEAMAAGKPCVTTRISSMPEIVRDGETGRVVPPADADSLAAALLEILDDPALAGRMGAAGRQVVHERFTVTRMIDQYEQVFRAYL
jgi:glycosyltransferase involved in cell wall biosynthesis